MCKYQEMTNREFLDRLNQNPALLDAVHAVVEASVDNTEAVQHWRGHFNGEHAPTQREQKARLALVTETRTALDEAVDAYRNAKCMARLQPHFAQLTDEAKLQEMARI